jgi:hypothetical protein
MRAYGSDWRSDHTLGEVTLVCSFEDVRRVARFINGAVAMIYSGYYTGKHHGHVHFRDKDASWTEGESDLVLAWDPSWVGEPRYTGQ